MSTTEPNRASARRGLSDDELIAVMQRAAHERGVPGARVAEWERRRRASSAHLLSGCALRRRHGSRARARAAARVPVE